MALGMKHGFYSASGGAGIITDGLILHLDAADTNSYPGSGDTWTDLSDEGNDVTLENSPTYNASGYFTFDGTNDYADRDDILGITDWPFTFSVWVKPSTGGSSTDTIMGFAKGSANIMYTTIGVASNDQFLVNIRNIGYIFTYLDDTPDARDGDWYNYVITCISDTERKTYINGVLNSSYGTVHYGGTYTIDVDVDFSTAQNSFDIGRLGRSSHTDYFEGDYATCFVYNRELSADEVLENYNVHKERFGY